MIESEEVQEIQGIDEESFVEFIEMNRTTIIDDIKGILERQ